MIYIAKISCQETKLVSVVLPMYRVHLFSCDLEVTTVHEKIIGRQKCDSIQELTCYSVSVTNDVCAEVEIINDFSFEGESDPEFTQGKGHFESNSEEFQTALVTAQKILNRVFAEEF